MNQEGELTKAQRQGTEAAIQEHYDVCTNPKQVQKDLLRLWRLAISSEEFADWSISDRTNAWDRLMELTSFNQELHELVEKP